MGRETKLDDLVEKRICDALRDGHSYQAAARAGGIAEATLHEWISRGRGTWTDRDDPEGRYAEFAERVRRADHEAEERCIQVLKSAIMGDDVKQATDNAKWWLARRRPAQWAEVKGEAPPTDAEVVELVTKIRKSGT